MTEASARKSMVRNTASLFATQLGTYAIPLLTIPYLSRTLGPEQFGLVAFMQAIALYVSLIIDFGFGYSGTREVARRRDDPGQLREIIGSVLGAKAHLVAGLIIFFVAFPYFSPTLYAHRTIMWLAVVSGIAQGLSVMWFYQGIERMSFAAAVDFSSKAFASASVFILVHHPADAGRVLAAQATFFVASAVLMHTRVHRDAGIQIPSLRSSRRSLRESFPLFALRSAGGLFSSANALILGIYAGPTAVGFYSGPDKVVKACYGLQSPISSSVYPRLVYLSSRDPAAARRLARSSALWQIGGIIPVSAAVYFAAPWIVRIFMGPGYGPSVGVLRILCFMLLPGVTAAVVGLQWMVAHGMEKILNRITISAGALNLFLAYFLVHRYRQNGMAFSVVVAEIFVAVANILYLTWNVHRKGGDHSGSVEAMQLSTVTPNVSIMD